MDLELFRYFQCILRIIRSVLLFMSLFPFLFKALYKSVKLVQKLRSAVSLTFEHLADGVKRTTPNDAVDASGASGVSNADVASVDGIVNATTTADDEKRLLEDLKKDLKMVRWEYRGSGVVSLINSVL